MASTDAAADQLGALINCLEAEYRALLTEDIGQLQAVLARKQQLLVDLTAWPTAMHAPHNKSAPAIAAVKQKLTHLRELNRRNAHVLAPRSAVIRARLRFLQAAAGRDPVYAADGSLTPAGVFRAAYPQSA